MTLMRKKWNQLSNPIQHSKSDEEQNAYSRLIMERVLNDEIVTDS